MLIFNYLSFCYIEDTEGTAQIKPDFPIDLMRLPCVLLAKFARFTIIL